MSDIVTFGETMLRLSVPEGERIESADHLACRSAGAESNVAIAAARLGAETTWLSKIPETALGRRVASDIRSHGVDVNVVWSDRGRQGTYYIEPAGEPRGTNVIYDRANAAVTTATPAELDTAAIEAAEIFFTTGITPALSETLESTVTDLLDTETTTAFDLNYRSKLWTESEARETLNELLPAVDILFAPERDARSILDVAGDPRTVAETLHSRYDCDTVVLTRGEEGAIAHTGAQTYEQDVFEADTVDPIGTGDAFVGAFLTRRVAGDDIPGALAWAAAAAALKRTIAGDIALITDDEVRDVLDAGEAGIDR